VEVPLEDVLVVLPEPGSVEVPVELLPLPVPVPLLPPLVVLLVLPVELPVLDPDDVVPEDGEPVEDDVPLLLLVDEPVPVEEFVDVLAVDTAVPVVACPELEASVVLTVGDGGAAGGGAAAGGELTLGGAISSGGANGGGLGWATLCFVLALVACDVATAVASFDCVSSETPTATAAASVFSTVWLAAAPDCAGGTPMLCTVAAAWEYFG
jgi:hypothetical protein